MAERFKFSDELINNPLNTHNNITYVKSNMDIEQKVFESSHPMNKLVMEEIENFQQSTGYRPANENDLAEILEYIPGANEKEKLITLSLLIGRTSDFLFSTKNGSSKRLRITKQMYKSSSLENHSSLAANLLMVKELDFRKS
ncbi:hypothetical protein KBC03_06335 [Patescibacteria group bacterium]|nr:hypothetical protein [Patescibacteria group bacterium]